MAFGKKRETEGAQPQPAFNAGVTSREKPSIVGRTLFVTGEINADEEILIEGKIEGKLNSKSRVIVGKNGLVNADIDAREVVIKGTVNGNVKGQFKVEVVPEGVLNGNIVSQRVVLAEGALFKGNIDMTPRDDKIPNSEIVG